MCVRRDTGDRESDWHGVVNEILELEYPGEPLKRVVLVTCRWYDPTHPRGTRKQNHYKIIEINHTKRYGNFDPFIITQNARQVYYLPYPGRCKIKLEGGNKMQRGQVEVDEVSKQAYQIDDPSPSKVVIDTDIPSNLCSISREVDIIELSRQYSMSQSDKRGNSTEDEDEE